MGSYGVYEIDNKKLIVILWKTRSGGCNYRPSSGSALWIVRSGIRNRSEHGFDTLA